ncbi:GNAT family N-acetyltransferase [Natrononativus amylolyticus]|uniref:GNAT family N-acetyltransferase n=1 Tax=Natrononativus amylolyticus TaxID=2963434 RepID=UPI0020CBD6EA|nr:GNAT family N-acetyltransferase [Natrononativus amylolyticus]
MTAEIRIRPATSGDALDIAALYRGAYESAAALGFPSRMTEIDAETVGEWLANDSTTLVALDDERLIGTVRLLYERDEPYLERLAVDPDRQGSGVGRRLMDRIEAVAREKEYDCIQLTTFDDHPFLLEWYEQRGYERTKRHERPERPYDFVSMEKPL